MLLLETGHPLYSWITPAPRRRKIAVASTTTRRALFAVLSRICSFRTRYVLACFLLLFDVKVTAAQNLRGEDIGIIAPYAAQISLLTRMLNTTPAYRTRFEQTLGSHRAMQLANIEVKTVDGFEGREKEVIIFSTVRNNTGGYIGFLADRRRLNVGLTRAKRGLFVVGNISTLKAGKMSQGTTGDGQTFARVGKGAEAWRRYAEFLGREKMVIQLSGERLAGLLYGNMPRPNVREDPRSLAVPMRTWSG